MQKISSSGNRKHTNAWLVIIWTLSDLFTIIFRLYFKALKLHETPCIYTTWQCICTCTDYVWTHKRVLIIITKDNSSRFKYKQRTEVIEGISVSITTIDARNLYSSLLKYMFKYMTVSHTIYWRCTFHELKSPTTESYKMTRYEPLPDQILLLLV